MKQLTDTRLKNGKEVTKDELINKIKTHDSTRFDQMLIETEERKIYYFVNYKSTAFIRNAYVLKFPVHNEFKRDFEENFLENEGGNTPVKVEKSQLIEALKRRYLAPPVNNGRYPVSSTPFAELKLEVTGNKVSEKQPFYYIPSETESCTCGDCNGQKYVTCPESECHGQHIYDCNKCGATGEIECTKCDGHGQYNCKKCSGQGQYNCKNCNGGWKKCSGCRGSGEIKCGQCAGTGHDNFNKRNCTHCAGRGVNPCSKCARKGEIRCTDCNNGIIKCTNCQNGIIRCDNCKARGKITCPKCDGKRQITCRTCYGDHTDNRYGKIDCSDCETTGEIGTISYIATEVITIKEEFLHVDGKIIDAPGFGISTIEKYVNVKGPLTQTYLNLNGVKKDNYDEYSKVCSAEGLKNAGFYKEKYHKLIEEEMYYEGVPCATFNYNHILSASYHDVSVLSIDKEKDVLFHSDPTAIADEKETTKEKINELCRIAFSTKAYKDKIDRKHEMFLMVHMAKADGIIEDTEKRALAQTITGLHGFTNKEKAELFGLMSANTLPPISSKNAYFSSKPRAEEAKKKIIELVAKADGEYEPLEKAKIEEINNAIEAGYKDKPSAIGRFLKTWQVSVSIFFLIGLIGSGGYFFGVVYPQMRAEKKAKRDLATANATRMLDSTLNAMNLDPSTVSLSEFSDGKITSKKAYFYEDKDGSVKSKSFCVSGDEIKYYPNSNTEYYYVSFTNKKGKEIKGWINKSQITIGESENNTNKAEEVANTNSNTANGGEEKSGAFSKKDLIAQWSGDFGKDKLVMKIESIDEYGVVTGFDEVKGNKRKLEGNCEETESGFKFRLSEPGDDKWDGVFTFVYNKNNNELKGEWVANNGKSTKPFTLSKN